jgi:hypothetical protein
VNQNLAKNNANENRKARPTTNEHNPLATKSIAEPISKIEKK